MFSPGDKVVCEDGSGTAAKKWGIVIVKGGVYTVKRRDGEFLFFEEIKGGWYHDRFVLYVPPENVMPQDVKVATGSSTLYISAQKDNAETKVQLDVFGPKGGQVFVDFHSVMELDRTIEGLQKARDWLKEEVK